MQPLDQAGKAQKKSNNEHRYPTTTQAFKMNTVKTALLDEKDLSNWCGYKRRGDIEKFCREHGVKFTTGKDGRILTTQAVLDAAILGESSNEIEFT
jgi:hypothetical protein